MTDIDYLITESTYANRMHRVRRSAHEELLEQVQDACVKRPGRLIIPAFSVGRTQAILFTLKRLIESGDLPQIPVFADSPLALESTNIHFRFHDLMNEEAREELKSTGELFGFEQLRLVQDEDDQEDMEYQRDPCIIVSSSGMMDGGRIQAHLQDQVMNPMCTVLIAGYCTPGTLGARLLNGENPVRILNKERYVYARIRQTDVFSAHPDEEGLLKYLKNSLSSRLKKLFLIHGVEEDMEVFQTRLKGELSCDVELPEKVQIFRLN
jgi:metallo-beta-lactamase family protein